MSDTTSAGAAVAASTATPSIRTFQIDPSGLGSMTESVNLFRADVTVPVRLLAITGRSGLEAAATLVYHGMAPEQVDTWNLDAPTGPVGAGWSMGYEVIALDAGAAVVPGRGEYYLVAQGMTNRLFRTSVTADWWEFELERYEFWRIRYFPGAERWEIVKEDGSRYVYGGQTADLATSPVQHGIKWGGPRGSWIGSSVQSTGQARFASAWNLASITNAWDDGVLFSYENDLVQLGTAAGLTYTRASRLRQVTVPHGRTLVYRYAPKTYDDQVHEYQVPHVDPTSPTLRAYQDRLETRYLESIEMRNADDAPSGAGELIVTARLGYDLVNASLHFQGDPDYYKRYLTGVTFHTPDGLSLPGYGFHYANDPRTDLAAEVNRGALRTIEHPLGGRATYSYARTTLAGTSRALDLFPSGTPRVWFGPDYTVLVEYDGVRQGLTVKVYSWNGLWIESPQSYVLPQSVDLESLRVSAQAEFFALSFRTRSGTPRLYLALFHKQYGRYGQWFMDRDFTVLPITDGEQGVVATGADFAVAVASGGRFAARVWDPVSKAWLVRDDTLRPNPSGRYALAAAPDYFALASYEGNVRRAVLAIYHLDRSSNRFVQASLQVGSVSGVEWEPATTPDLFWALGANYAAMTYVTDRSAAGIGYRVEVQQWGDDFAGRLGLAQSYRVPADTNLPYAQTIASGGVVGNLDHLFRFDGAQWIGGSLPIPAGSAEPRFVYGSDAAIVSGTTGAALAVFDPYRSRWSVVRQESGTQGGFAPTANGDYLSMGRQLLYRLPSGQLRAIGTLDPNTVPESLANRAPAFVATQDTTGSTHVLPLADGGADFADAVHLPNERIVVPGGGHGTGLVGPSSVLTYTGGSFDRPTRLTLRQYLQRDAAGPVDRFLISGLRLDDGYPSEWGHAAPQVGSGTRYHYDCDNVTITPDGTVAEFAAATAMYGVIEEHGGPACYPPPEATPFGRSEYRFHNNRSPRDTGLVPSTEPMRSAAYYYTYLDGMLYDQTDYDAAGEPVERVMNVYEVRADRAPIDAPSARVPLVGGYVRQTLAETSQYERVIGVDHPAGRSLDVLPAALVAAYRARGVELPRPLLVPARAPGRFRLYPDRSRLTYLPVTQSDGSITAAVAVTRTVGYEHSPAAGLLVADWTTGYDSQGERSTVRREVFYGWQVPEYRELGARHILSAVVLSMRFHQAAGKPPPGSPIELALTTMQRWGEGGAAPWAPRRSYAALSADVYDPARTVPVRFDDWANVAPPPALWRLSGEVLARTPAGAVLESTDVTGTASCSVFDRDGTRRLADFVNARSGAVAYLGFEAYESTDGWEVAAGGPVEANIVAGDAHTGSRSFALQPDPRQFLATSVALPGDGTPSILSCWVRTPAGFDADAGSAAWTVERDGVPVRTLPIEGTGGDWRYRHWVVRVEGQAAGADVRLRLVARNEKRSAASVLQLDDVMVGPLGGSASATVYDARFGDELAIVELGGATPRAILDSRRRTMGEVNESGRVRSVASLYQVREGAPPAAPFAFPQDAPNQLLAIDAGDGGLLADLVQGDRWTGQWDSPAMAHWAVRDGVLVHVSPADDRIRYTPTDGLTDYGARVSVQLPAGPGGGPAVPGGPVGVAIGEDLAATWLPAEGWEVRLPGETVRTGSRAFATDLTLVAARDPRSGRTSAFFLADGRPLLARLGLPPIAGALSLRAGEEGGGFRSIAHLVRPQPTPTPLARWTQRRQAQAFTGSGTVVAGSVFDPIGRAALGVKPVAVEGGAPGYRRDYVEAFDPVSGVMSGLAARRYPGDQGYPYTRTEFRRTAQSLAAKQGVPGRPFSIVQSGPFGAESDTNPHVTRIEYGTNVQGQFGGDPWPSNQYFVTKVTNPDGDVTYLVRTQADQQVAEAVGGPDGLLVTRYAYDGAGRETMVLPPAGVAARRAGDPDWRRWATVSEYDFAGSAIAETTPDSGTSRFVYDAADRMRFSLSAEGDRPDGPKTIVYSKYDRMGRVTEQGFFEGPWDRAELERRAVEEPGWPDASRPHVVTHRNRYDGDGSDPTLFGRLASSVTTAPDGSWTVEERFRYDLRGNVLERLQSASGFDGPPRAVRYRYDNLDEVAAIAYPAGSHVAEVTYTQDATGRTYQVGTPDDPAAFGTFEYDETGSVTGSTVRVGPGAALERRVTYNSPGWPEQVRQRLGTLPVLDQDISYTAGGHEGAGYFDGRIAAVEASSEGERQADRYGYDALSRVTADDTTGAPPASLAYDANGNIRTFTSGTTTRAYGYEPRSNRVEALTEGGSEVDRYTYNRDGGVTSARRAGIERIEYDPVTGLPDRMRLRSGGLQFRYLSDGARAAKVVTDGGGEVQARLYVRGTTPDPLVEEARGGDAPGTVQYVYGPEGLIALLDGPRRYTVVRDHLGSVRRVVDESGEVVASYDYTAFGVTVTRPEGGEIRVGQFTGQELDPETGLYNFHARLYDPVLGRFYDVDPAGTGASPYVYVSNNPSNMVDPNGEEPLTAFLIVVAISAIVGMVAGAVTYALTHQGNFDAGKFLTYAAVGLAAGAVAGAAAFGAGLLATAGLAAVGVSTSTSIASGVVVGAASAAVDGVVAGSLNQIGVNLVEGLPYNEGVGAAAIMGVAIGAATGGLLGGITGALHTPVSKALWRPTRSITAQNAHPNYHQAHPSIQHRFLARQGGMAIAGGNGVPAAGRADVIGVVGHGSRTSSRITMGAQRIRATTIAQDMLGPGGRPAIRGINCGVCYAGRSGIARTFANDLHLPVLNSSWWPNVSRGAAQQHFAYYKFKLFGRKFMPFGVRIRAPMRTYYPSKIQTGWVALFGY